VDVSFLVQYGRVGRSIRSGIRMRLSTLPPGINYRIMGEPIMSTKFNEYGLSPFSMFKTVIRIFFDNISPLSGDVIHAFFWWYRRMGDNWILENDQSLSQFFRIYGNHGRVPQFISDFMYRKATVITWTNWARLGFIRDGFQEDRIHVIDLPVWPQWVNIGRKIENSVIFVGIDFYLKGGDTALGIFKELKERWGSKVKTTYIGSIPNEYKNGLRYVDEYYPPSPSSAVMRKIGESQVLILPSRWDAYGITALEAMMRGTAVVSSSAGGLPEVVGDAGIICRNNSCMLDAVEDLLMDTSMLKRQINNQLETLATRHNPERVTQSLSEVYESFMRR